MLRNRIITALVLAPLALLGILYLPPAWFAIVFWMLAGLGVYEWAGLFGLKNPLQRSAYVVVLTVLAYWLYGQTDWYQSLLFVSCGLWVWATIVVFRFPRHEALFRNRWLMAGLGVALILPAWVAMLVIHAFEPAGLWLSWVFVLIWGADIGAYFAGRAYGKNKLAPRVSPGKTWQGVIGGFAMSATLGGIGLLLLQGQLSENDLWRWLLPLMCGLIAVSVIGDLFESVVKRSSGVKDSGTLLPGHGGVLDRIDSLLAVLPVFAAFVV